ncbi:uncharacterized protein LOC141849590 [Brevipalpus obovatus]|uniref:uncharacterized protein LOC141849590 n=1 Tax=Brevipalpus obovatus TaxID=246614 RepID=UPI003D9E34B9
MYPKFPFLDERLMANYIANEFSIEPHSAFELINSPDSDKLFRLLGNFLKEFGVENYDRFQMVGNVYEDLQKHPGLYSNACQRVNVSKAVGHFLAKCGFHDWNFDDLINPKREKVQVILSQFIGIHEEFFKRTNVIDELTPRFERKADETRQKKEQIERFQDVIEKKLIDVAEMGKDAEIKRKECLNVKKDVEAKKTKIQGMQGRRNDWIVETQKLDDEKAAQEAQVAKLQENMLEKRNSIIQSPEKLFEEVNESERKLYSKRRERQELENRKLECFKHHNILVDILNKLAKTKPQKDKSLADVCREIEIKWKEFCQELDRWIEKVLNTENHIENLESKLEKLEGKRRAVEREHSQFLKDFQKKVETLNSMIQEVETSMSNIHLERDEKKRKAQEEHDHLVKDLEELELNRSRKREEFERFKQEIQKKCQDASENLRKRCDCILKIVKEQ